MDEKKKKSPSDRKPAKTAPPKRAKDSGKAKAPAPRKAKAQKENTILNEEQEAEKWLEEKLTSMPSVRADSSDELDSKAVERGDVPMSVVAHLGEFRSRIIIILSLFIAFMFIAFGFSDYIVNFINMPFEKTGLRLNMFKILGGFFIRLKASALAAFLLIIPVLIFHIWRFIMPAMEKSSRRFTLLSFASAVLLFYAGVAFVFFLLVPFVVPIMTAFIPENMLTTIGADDYLGFVMMFSVAMGVLFEMPVAVLVLTRLGLITPQFLVSKRKAAVVINFIIGGLVTPQDPMSMFFVAIPLIILYEISIYISKLMTRRMEKSGREAAKT